MNARHVASMVAGHHGRRRPGIGDAFWQFRPAQAGDALGQIDWRQSGKGELLHVRETEAQAAHHTHLWCDMSPSMAWRSSPALALKRDRALLLALGLGCLLLQAGERVAALGIPGPALTGNRALERLARGLTAPLEHSPSGDAMPPPPYRPKRRQSMIVFSDFWHPLDRWEQWIKTMAGMGLRGHLVQVVDGAEETLPFKGRAQVSGLEGETPFLAERIEDLAPAFAARVTAHRAALRAMAESAGWSFLRHRTDHPPAGAVLALFARLQSRIQDYPKWR
jgi:uncharacterized protein (DUF58 family)